MKRFYPAIAVLVLQSGLLLSAQEQAQLEMRLYSQAKTVSMGEPINIEFTAKNNALAPMTLDLGLTRQGAFRFDIGAPDGTVARVFAPPLLGGPETPVRVGLVPVEPGQTYKQIVRLGQWYSFPLPGAYVVTAHLTGEQYDIVVDRPFTITVTAADANQLMAKCEQLAAKALDQTTYAGGFEAGIDLSLIKDPIAVPYLERLFSGQLTARLTAIEGLERIATLEATDALLKFFVSADGEDRSRTVAALVKIGRSTRSTAVRERIRATGIMTAP